jgi:hypothetical protein
MEALSQKLDVLLDDMETSLAIGRRAQAYVLNHLTWRKHAENVLSQAKIPGAGSGCEFSR